MTALPFIIQGGSISDERGKINFNNSFNASEIKRIYFIENNSVDFIRGWQGHKVEKRWFLSVVGYFRIKVIHIDNWLKPSTNNNCSEFYLSADDTNVLYVPNGYITSIQALENNSKLMAMSDFLLGEIQDEFRFEINYFK